MTPKDVLRLFTKPSMFDVHFLVNPLYKTTPKWHGFFFDQTGRFSGQRRRSYEHSSGGARIKVTVDDNSH